MVPAEPLVTKSTAAVTGQIDVQEEGGDATK